MPPLPDYYARLGVAPDASGAEIRRAFREKAKKTHPDVNPNDPEAAQRFRKLKEAHEVLTQPRRRARYDRRRAQTAEAPEVVTVTSVSQTGCVTYYLPRVAIGLLACVAFFVLEAFDVWRLEDPETLLLAIAGASAVTGALAVLVFWLFPDTSDDYAVRFGTKDVRVWSENRLVARIAWSGVEQVEVDADRQHVTLTLAPGVGDGLGPIEPVIPRIRKKDGCRRVTLALAGTDARLSALFRFFQRVHGPVQKTPTSRSSPSTSAP